MFDQKLEVGTSADIITVLRLTPMNTATRTATISSVRTLRDALAGSADIPVHLFFEEAKMGAAELRAKIGERHAQVLSDVRRAARAWENEPRRELSLSLRGRLPSLQDAHAAATSLWSPEKVNRTTLAVNQLATAQNTSPDNIAATATVVSSMLRAATPEDFQVTTLKSMNNKKTLIRNVIALVDPNALSGREADVKSLPANWRDLLEKLNAETPAHAKSVVAIFRRLALRANHMDLFPDQLDAAFIAGFVEYERATKSDKHIEKLRAAGRIWNKSIQSAEIATARFEVAGNAQRLPDVAWSTVPEAIRAAVEDLMSRTVAPQGDEDWASFVTGGADEGLGLEDLTSTSESTDVVLRELGTQRNLRDAVKRVWHAASEDSSVIEKPRLLEDLFRADCLLAVVRAVRQKRRARVEAAGKKWEDNEKGRYECSLIQALLAVGKSCDLPPEVLDPVREFTIKLDPSVVARKIQADGTYRTVYEDRKIGPHHETMLRQFQEQPVFARWFGAPKVLWREAERWKRQGKSKPTIAHASLARSALVAQIAQRVTPMRRTNLARLRAFGDASHLQLPVGKGEGTLMLPAAELKNLRSIYVTIDKETVVMIKQFIEVYRPIFAQNANAHPENEHLFPGAANERKEKGEHGGYAKGFGYLTKVKLSQRFRQHMKKYCMLNMDLQVMRHIAGKVILDMDPSAMALVQEVLGHKRIETTRSYYAEVNKIIAQKNYLSLLDQYTRRVMTNVDFRVEIQQTVGE